MSTYDAYNLSLRDSTEFTVPTGESGSSGRLDIFKIKIRIDPGNSEPKVRPSFMFCRIKENPMFNLSLVMGLGQDAGVQIPLDNEQHEIEAIAVDGNATVVWDESNLSIKSASDTISVEDYEGQPYIVASGDGSIDFVYGNGNGNDNDTQPEQ